MSPLQDQDKHPSEDLGSHYKVKTQSIKLVDFPLESDQKLMLWVQVNGNLKVGIPEITRTWSPPSWLINDQGYRFPSGVGWGVGGMKNDQDSKGSNNNRGGGGRNQRSS